jgi:DNA-binding response OmpR family regulator
VQPCANAEQALAMLRPTRAEDLDLLITDVVLGPGLRGTELAAQVRALRADLPVLLMSGYSSDLLAAEHALGASGPELLRKPFLREELAGAIVGVIARSQPQASQHRPG